MKRKISVLILFVMLVSVQLPVIAQEQQPQKSAEKPGEPAPQPAIRTPRPAIGFGLEDGTPIRMRISRTISSADAKVGDRVDFEVLDDIKTGTTVVIPRGGVAWGTVTEAQPRRTMGRAGKLNVNINAVKLADGEKVALRAVKEVQGGSHTGAMAGAMVATSVVFFPAAPLFLFIHGKDITIPKGTEITAYVNGDTQLDPAKFGSSDSTQLQPIPAPAPPPDQAAAEGAHPTNQGPDQPAGQPDSEASSVVIRSTPDGADITIDGKFAGSTPSTIKLMPGDHTVLIEKSGFKSWQRTLTVGAGGSVTLDANLEKVPNPSLAWMMGQGLHSGTPGQFM